MWRVIILFFFTVCPTAAESSDFDSGLATHSGCNALLDPECGSLDSWEERILRAGAVCDGGGENPARVFEASQSALSLYVSILVDDDHPSRPNSDLQVYATSLTACFARLCSSYSDVQSSDLCGSLQESFTQTLSSAPLPSLMIASIFNDLATAVASPSSDYKESFLRAAVGAHADPAIVKNLGFLLEQTDRVNVAVDMYNQALTLYPHDKGLLLARACICPPHHDSVAEAEATYVRITTALSNLISEVSDLKLSDFEDDPTLHVGQMPLGWPYLGYAMRPLATLLSTAYLRLFPSIALSSIPIPALRARTSSDSIRLGVIAEYGGNTSPGNLIQTLLTSLPPNIELVFFPPPSLSTPFSSAISAASISTSPLNAFSVKESQRIVASENLDAVIFMAIGMAPLTYYMSFSHLAPVTIVYGHGHPITSAVPAVDYFISSDLFAFGDENRNAASHPPMLSNGWQSYSEQLVKFDSLTTNFVPPKIDITLRSLPMYGLDKDGRYYACLQYSKKLHAGFDEILRDILATDAEGRILLLEGAKRFIPRFKARGFTEDMLNRILFVRRMPREDLMGLLGLCKVMLGTFPWGEGVTSFEAFSVALPVVILPEKVTVEQLTLGQIRTMGLERELVAQSAQDYVDKVVRLGRDQEFLSRVRGIIDEKKILLFGPEQLSSLVNEFVSFLSRAVNLVLSP